MIILWIQILSKLKLLILSPLALARTEYLGQWSMFVSSQKYLFSF